MGHFTISKKIGLDVPLAELMIFVGDYKRGLCRGLLGEFLLLFLYSLLDIEGPIVIVSVLCVILSEVRNAFVLPFGND